jgi:hypothetical protein
VEIAEWEKELLATQEHDRLAKLVGLLASELTAQTGHWQHAPPGIARHDRRMADGGCATCALLELARRDAR